MTIVDNMMVRNAVRLAKIEQMSISELPGYYIPFGYGGGGSPYLQLIQEAYQILRGENLRLRRN